MHTLKEICLVCRSAQQVEDKQYFFFTSLMPCGQLQSSHASLCECVQCQDLSASCEANTCGGLLRSYSSLKSNILTT